MIRKYIGLFTILLSLMMSSSIFAQSLEEIKDSGDYLYGVGIDKELKESDSHALKDLISQISVHVTSDFEHLVTEVNGEIAKITKSVVNTYSATSLNNAKKHVTREGANWHTVRYILKKDLEKVFEERKQKIIDFARVGEGAEQEGRIGDALRHYYWSFILLRSHPDNQSIRFQFEGKPELALIISLQDRMNRIFSGLKFNIDHQKTIIDEESKTYILDVSYNGEKVENLDYRFLQGNDQSVVKSVNDGIGVIDLYGQAAQSMDKTWLYVEYQYQEKMMDPDIRSIFQAGDKYFFPFLEKSEREFTLKEPNKDIPNVTSLQQQEVEAVHSMNVLDSEHQTEDYKEIVTDVLENLTCNKLSQIQDNCTQEGFEVLSELTNNGHLKVLGVPETLEAIQLNDEVMLRSIPMSFSFNNNRRTFIEKVNFIFNKEGKIDNVSFSISDRSLNDILNKPESYATPEEKLMVVKFMEDYKTAYSLKRLDYIESIFAENALIIVGKVLKEEQNNQNDQMLVNLPKKRIQYLRKDKKSYINSLKRVFQMNEFVNIQFEESKVMKRNCPNEKLFGVQIEQHYFSTHYADKGYLFLAVDLTDIELPKIYVRTWQPEKDQDGHVFNLQDFNFGDCDTIGTY